MADGKKGRKTGPRKVIPKQVLGVSIPKELRRAGDQLIESASGPAGRQVIAGALTMAAAAAGTAVAAARAAEQDGMARDGAAKEDGATAHTTGDAQSVVAAVEQAAEALLGKFFARGA